MHMPTIAVADKRDIITYFRARSKRAELLIIRPHREFVAVGVAEMESASAGE